MQGNEVQERRLTCLDIIDETVEFYSKDPSRRGVMTVGGFANLCSFYTNTGKSCAVGRCMLDPSALLEEDRDTDVVGLEGAYGSLDIFLKERYRGHSTMFWQRLQRFHDVAGHFEPHGLTKEGWAYVNEMRKDCSP